VDKQELLETLMPNADAATLEALIELAEADFKAECQRDDVPEGAESVIVRMVQHRYGQLDGAGLASQSYSGASETFRADWPDDLKRAMWRWRKGRFA
jgi:hypothetical protein